MTTKKIKRRILLIGLKSDEVEMIKQVFINSICMNCDCFNDANELLKDTKFNIIISRSQINQKKITELTTHHEDTTKILVTKPPTDLEKIPTINVDEESMKDLLNMVRETACYQKEGIHNLIGICFVILVVLISGVALYLTSLISQNAFTLTSLTAALVAIFGAIKTTFLDKSEKK